MIIIGLTGPSGAGKSTLCEKFEELKIPCVNTDDVYHNITSTPSSCLNELRETFGNGIINEQGTLNRAELAKLVFEGNASKDNLEMLNTITHKYVWEATNEILTKHIKHGKKVAVIDAPALFSSKVFVGACNFTISVLCDKEIRIERIMKRDNISYEKALARINSQPNDDFFIKSSDYVITNCGDPDGMINQLYSILEQEAIYVK